MDGRFLIKRDPDELKDWKTWNAAPTQLLPVIVERGEGQRERLRMHWGLVPLWPHAANCPIEARSETLFERPMFRELARFRRCIVPMSDYYEWHPDEKGKKRPYCITARDGEQWGVAGLWDETSREGSDAAGSFTIVTMPATPVVARIHPRMPVILPRDREDAWLSADVTDARAIRRLVQPYPETAMRIYRVSDAVSNMRNNRPELIEPEFKQATLW